MSFNFSQLQQAVDRLLINSSEAINKLVDLSIAPARDVQIQYYDRNGNLVTQTTPNMMKVLNTVQTNINSYMQKTVYVDQVNGDDNNDGTQTRPFKTLQKAFNSVPVGGSVTVNLLSDYNLDSFVYILSKKLAVLNLNGFNLNLIYFEKHPTYGWYRGAFSADNSTFVIRFTGNSAIVDTDKPDDTNLANVYPGIVNANGLNCHILIECVNFTQNEVIRLKDGFVINRAQGYASSSIFFITTKNFERVTNIVLENNSKFLRLANTSIAIIAFLNNLFKFKDSSNNEISLANAISGIVRDSNNIPRNVISNVII